MSEVPQPPEPPKEAEPNQNPAAPPAEVSDPPQPVAQDKYVPKHAYEDVSRDMHKYKTKSKQLEAENNQLVAEKEAQEKARLEDEGRWKEIAEQESKKRLEAESKFSNLQSDFISGHKRSAVESALGGFKKSQYKQFIDLDKVEIGEDGYPTPGSVDNEVNRIRKAHPELLKEMPAPALPNEAPIKYEPAPPRPVSKMSRDERSVMRRQALRKSEEAKRRG